MLDHQKLEQLLLRNWLSFIDHKRLMAFTLQHVRDANLSFIDKPLQFKGTQLKLSRFQPVAGGFKLWIEFVVSIEENIAIGTTEAYLPLTAEIQHLQTIGTKFRKMA